MIKERALDHVGSKIAQVHFSLIMMTWLETTSIKLQDTVFLQFKAHNRPYSKARHVMQSMEQSGPSTTHTTYQPLLQCENKIERSIVVVGSDDLNSNYDGYKGPTTMFFCDYI